MQQQLASLQVGQELVTEAYTLARALEKPGHVGEGEHVSLSRPIDHTQHGFERGEGVVGHLRLGVGQPHQERRLARIR